MKVRCPHCRAWVEWSQSPFRPFCGEACKQADLGNWAMEKYRLPEEEGEAAIIPMEPPVAASELPVVASAAKQSQDD